MADNGNRGRKGRLSEADVGRSENRSVAESGR